MSETSAGITGLVAAEQNTQLILSAMLSALRSGLVVQPTPTSYAVAALPATGAAGQFAWASNGRKPGEGAGSGTGVPVFWNPSTAQWFSYLSGAVVTV